MSAPEFFVSDISGEPEYIMALVLEANVDDPGYYGVNVLFYPDGTTKFTSVDKISDQQVKDHADLIKATALTELVNLGILELADE